MAHVAHLIHTPLALNYMSNHFFSERGQILLREILTYRTQLNSLCNLNSFFRRERGSADSKGTMLVLDALGSRYKGEHASGAP